MEKINSPKLLDTCLASEYQSRLFALTYAIVKASRPMPYHQPGAEGGLIVVTRSDQTLYVNIATSTGEQNYTCEVEVDMPAPVNGKSSTLIPVGEFERDLYKQGCKLTLSFGDEGATVDAEGDSCHSFCGLNGYFAGKYLKRTRK